MDQKTHDALKKLAFDIKKAKDDIDRIQADVDDIVEGVISDEK